MLIPTTQHERREPSQRNPAVGTAQCHLSVIVPIFNEEDNVEPLYLELTEVLDALDHEIVFVDDGSVDRSSERLLKFAERDPRVLVIQLRRNFGQTAALAAGIEHSRGRIIVPIDGDMQNDPHSIPALLAKLDEPPGYDIVSGWRRNRQDRWLNRRLPSQIANALIRRFTHVPIHDFGCTLKAYRREVIDQVSLSSDLHRFLPALAVWHGARITETVVNHRPRTRGKTKYGLRRTIRVLLDLVIVKFLGGYMNKPLYFFGKLALAPLLLALVLLVVSIGQKFGYLGQSGGLNLNRNILVTLSALLAFLSVQCILLGILSELLVRIYHDIRGQPIYRIRHTYRKAVHDAAGASVIHEMPATSVGVPSPPRLTEQTCLPPGP